MQKVVNYSEFVENNRLHVPAAGIDPKVLIDNTTYPRKVVEREDEDNEIPLAKFETENTLVRRPDAIEYSYNKLESVIGQHRATLRKSVAMKAAHAYAPNTDTPETPVILTTGELTNGRRRITFEDILRLKERFDAAEIPLTDRYIILHPKHVSDLLLEDIKLFKDLTNVKDGEPFRFGGFGCYQFAQMPTYKFVSGKLIKVPLKKLQRSTLHQLRFTPKR